MALALLPDRGVLALTGPDRVSFLQGLVSNDVTAIAPGRAIWAALLTPQGRWLADFFILPYGEALLLETERAAIAALIAHFARYRLRAQVAFEDVSPRWAVHALWEGEPSPPSEGVAFADPRLPEAGLRLLAPQPLASADSAAAYERHRLLLGLPDGSKDLEAGKTLLLEAGFDELHGISWTKGCYLGQEVTARTRYRGLIKRRLVPVSVEAGPLPARGTVLFDAAGREAGEMRSGLHSLGLALLRLEVLERDEVLQPAGGAARLRPRIPPWLRLPRAAVAPLSGPA